MRDVPDSRPSMLIMSFSPIATDPRVIKQVRRFVTDFAVTTCGFGPAPDGVVEHIELDPYDRLKLDGRLITARSYRLAYWSQAAVRAARRVLAGRRFDVAIANDIDALPLMLTTRTRHGVLADMHEYFPRWQEENALWKKRIGPYYLWLCRRYLPRAAAITTVSGGLAREYAKISGKPVEVVTNATPYHELTPGPVGEKIRVVHSGGATRRRNIGRMIEALGRIPDRVDFDLYLVANDVEHYAELERLAAATENVRVLPGVPYRDLIPLLNEYDVGVYVAPPVSFNMEWMLPNKFFDFVQARLGIVVGPSPEMAAMVRADGLGLVTDGFEVDDIAAALGSLDRDQVARWKAASHAAASRLTAEAEIATWERTIEGMLAS